MSWDVSSALSDEQVWSGVSRGGVVGSPVGGEDPVVGMDIAAPSEGLRIPVLRLRVGVRCGVAARVLPG